MVKVKFYCGTKNDCPFKEQHVNDRCFAKYIIRQTCRYLKRADGKTWEQGSLKEEPLMER